MTPEEWKQVETALSGSFGVAKLRVDGYELWLVIEQAKPLKYVISVYVNGWMRGEWLMKDCEERRRFCCPRKTRLYMPAQKAKLTKGLGKRAIAKYFPNIDHTITWYSSAWGSFSALKRHLLANNKQIELQEVKP